jgi:hypothetical protein
MELDSVNEWDQEDQEIDDDGLEWAVPILEGVDDDVWDENCEHD